jgi:hypothetical protein
MKTNTAMFIFVVGMIVTLFGVGGIEASITDTELAQSIAVALVGLLLAWVSTLALRVSDRYDQ